MRQLLESQISKDAFEKCWNDRIPPFAGFLDAASQRLSAQLPGEIQELSASISAQGDNRLRIDGCLLTNGVAKTYYVEIVWLPSSGTYRGTASVWDTPPEPPPKSVDQFIKELDAIVDEEEIIFEGQVFNAMEGIDEDSDTIRLAYPAIFRLFERFPDESFGNPGHLVNLIEERGQHEELLIESIHRVPSIPAIYMAYSVARTTDSAKERSRWLSELRLIADSSRSTDGVVDYTIELLNYHATLTNTEQAGSSNGG